MATKMRFRTDSPHYAELAAKPDKAREWHGDQPERLAEILATPPPQPGDTWRIRWHSPDGQGPIAGYAICCPKCLEVHRWSSANNCTQGLINGVCMHGRSTDGGRLGSCWQWSGNAESNALTASPSLWANGEGACGWHGWLRNGELTVA